jgi:AraC-like DNA-binding protein
VLTQPLFSTALLTAPDEFAASWSLHQLGRLIVSQVQFTAQEFVRAPGRHDLTDDSLLLLELYESGSGRGSSGDQSVLIDHQRLHLVDLSRSYRTVTTSVQAIGVVIPHAAVHYDPRHHPSYFSLGAGTPQGALLAAALRALVAQLPYVTSREAPALSEAFAGLVRSLLLTPSNSPEPAGFGLAQAARIRSYIDLHLGEELNAQHLSVRFGVSRATLYRLFRVNGGIEAYIRDRRLDRCSVELMRAAPERGRVRTVAERLGFTDAGHFTRAFRQRFGVAPTDHLGARLRSSRGTSETPDPTDSQASVRLFGEWLRWQAAVATPVAG